MAFECLGKCGRLKQVVKNSVCGLGGREALFVWIREGSVGVRNWVVKFRGVLGTRFL